jgi:hypothetical protein
MTTKLAEYGRSQRFARWLTSGELARRIGAANVSKIAGRLDWFEREGIIKPDLLDSLIIALELDRAVVEALIREDEEESFREWNKWASQWVGPHLITRLIPGVWMHGAIPDKALSPSDAEAFAIGYAREKQRSVCLVLSRRVSIWVRSNGRVAERIEAAPGQPNQPFMTLRSGSKRFVLDFGCDALLRQV